jgi:hypothetical protein
VSTVVNLRVLKIDGNFLNGCTIGYNLLTGFRNLFRNTVTSELFKCTVLTHFPSTRRKLGL